MHYTITTKGFELSNASLKYLERNLNHLSRFLADFGPDLPTLDLVLRKHKKKRLDHVVEEVSVDPEISFVNVTPKSPSPIYYDGVIALRLPKKPLVTHMEGKTADEALTLGFERLIKELDTYKGEHFTGDSEYPDHSTIRKPVT